MTIHEGVHYIYTVQPGDTVYSIATRYGSTVQLLEQTNALFPPVTDPGFIYPGQVLVVSETGIGQRNVTSYIIRPGDNLYRIAQRFSTSPDLLVGMNPLITNPSVILAGVPLAIPAVIYEVNEGDTLFKISRRLGVSLPSVIQANEHRAGFSPDYLFVGYRLIIPLPTSNNIVILNPLPGSRIVPGQALEGIARAFEAAILYQIRDDNDVIVTNERPIMTSAGAPAYGNFSTSIAFDRQPTAAVGELWVYARSAQDGRIIDLVQLKVRFQG